MSIQFLTCVSLYALINIFYRCASLWPLCSLSWSHPSLFSSLHLYQEEMLLVHPTTKNQNMLKVFNISTYMWYFAATPSKFSCATFKTFKLLLIFVPLFLSL